MKNSFFPMKIPQKRVWMLAVSLSLGQVAFPVGNNVSGESSVASPIVQQNRKWVSGTVTDSYGPVIGASVLVKGTTNGVITDLDGNFKLEVPVGATIVVSYVGYDNKEIVYTGQSSLKIELNENVQELQEVQVVAYGTTKKVTVTGAMSSITAKDVLKTPVSSIGNALSGKMPGLSTVQTTGQPGADDATLYVRGVGSLSESMSRPLMLVDGVERSFFQLDPNEVEDITILKDASATAVFGVRGANGVILVTTKRGQEGKAKVNFSTSVALQVPTRMPEFANSYEYASNYVAAQRRDGVAEGSLAFTDATIETFRTGSNPMAYPDTDWIDMLIKGSALQTQHNLTISGGTKQLRYFASLGVFTQDGLFRSFETDYNANFKYNRYNYRVNLDMDVTKTTQLRVNIGGRVTDRRQPNYEGNSNGDLSYLFRDIYWATPFSGVGLVDGKWIWSDTKTIANIPGNMRDGLYPYYGKGYNTRGGNTLNFDFVAEQKLDFLTKGLKVHVKGSYNSGVTLYKVRTGTSPHYETIMNTDGSINYRRVGEKTTLGYSESVGKSRDWYVEAAVNYKRDFGKHHVTGLVMYNESMTYYPSSYYVDIPRSYIGLVGRATYDWNTRYMLDVNIGYNGSENFAPGKRFGLFPAFSAGWIVSEEKFMQPLKPFLNYLKLRASFGIVGNDQTSSDARFLYLLGAYNTSPISSSSSASGSITATTLRGFYFGNKTSTVDVVQEAKLGNMGVTWETAAKQNYGIDLYLLNSKLKVNMDYFIEHRRDILISRKTNPTYFAVQMPAANLGKVNNKGYEVSVTWKDNVIKFDYNIGISLSYAKNKIVFMDEVPQPYEYMSETGRSVGQNFGYKFDGFFSEAEVATYEAERGKTIPDYGSGFAPHAGDAKFKDLNGDMKIDQNDVCAIGNPVYPQLTGGINLGFSYKGFDFSMTWQGAAKVSRMLDDIFRTPYGPNQNYSLVKYFTTDTWTQKGDAAKFPAITFANSAHNNRASDLWLRDASYLRLKNVEIGYSFSKKALQKMHLGSLRIYATGYNLLTFDKLKVIDPEARTGASTMYPVVKVMNLGLKLGF